MILPVLTRKLVWATCLALALISCSTARAERRDLIEETLRLTGVQRLLLHLDSAILAAIPDDAFPDPKTRREAEALLQKEAPPSQLQQIVALALQRDLNRAALEEVAAFYSTPLGKKVGQVTGTSLLPGNLREVRGGRKLVVELSDNRHRLLERILAADRVVQWNATLLAEAVKGLVEGAEFEKSPGSDSDDRSHKLMPGIDSAIRSEDARTTEMALMASAYTYRSLTDSELETFAKHCESPAAQWFRDALHEGLRRCVYQSSNTLGRFLGRARRALDQGSPTPAAAPAAPAGADRANREK